MPHFAASDLGLHCLPMSHKKEARHIWIKLQLEKLKSELEIPYSSQLAHYVNNFIKILHHFFQNSVEPDHLASSEASCSGSTHFVIVISTGKIHIMILQHSIG